MTDIRYHLTKGVKDATAAKKLFPAAVINEATLFHSQLPGYRYTPCVQLPHLAKELGVGEIWVKDESQRLSLNSFKALGGSYAIYRLVQQLFDIPDEKMSYEYLLSSYMRAKLQALTFASATDGNHGKGVAWFSALLGAKCHIYVPSDTTASRIEAIKAFGAQLTVVQGTYDDAVNQVKVDAKAHSWHIVSDTSWSGYTQVPLWIMQGYATMMKEIEEQRPQGPTHIIIQAGVGALGAAVLGYYYAAGDQEPISIIVEPEKAACLLESAQIADGKAHAVGGSLQTIMAGLSCGQPSEEAWNILKGITDAYLSVPDYVAALGMRILASPVGDDAKIVSGESAAVGVGTLAYICKEAALTPLRQVLELDESSRILFISTEGNTDPSHYRSVVWEGTSHTPATKRLW